MNATQALKRLDALNASLKEFNLRRDAQRVGVSFYTRARWADPSFTPSSQAPWRTLPKRTRKLFEQACKRRRTQSDCTLCSFEDQRGHCRGSTQSNNVPFFFIRTLSVKHRSTFL
jgi:hypothetical protein